MEKLYALDDVIIAEMAAVMAVEFDEEFLEQIDAMLESQDLNREKAQNWIDNGRDPKDYYLISCHNRLNNMGKILVLVESRAIRLGIVEMDREPSIPELFKAGETVQKTRWNQEGVGQRIESGQEHLGSNGEAPWGNGASHVRSAHV